MSGELITTFDTTPSGMTKFMHKHFKKCISKEEREAFFKEHPCPDVDVWTPPKADKYITDFLGKRNPKNSIRRVGSTTLFSRLMMNPSDTKKAR